jgi:hypothetical protein
MPAWACWSRSSRSWRRWGSPARHCLVLGPPRLRWVGWGGVGWVSTRPLATRQSAVPTPSVLRIAMLDGLLPLLRMLPVCLPAFSCGTRPGQHGSSTTGLHHGWRGWRQRSLKTPMHPTSRCCPSQCDLRHPASRPRRFLGLRRRPRQPLPSGWERPQGQRLGGPQ